jgi:hypothetical protein
MRSNRRLYLTATAMVAIVVVLWLSTSMAQVRQRYEVETRVYSTPEYRTEATRAMDAYERVMERYMDVTEKNFEGISADIGDVAGLLESIDAQLTRMDRRLERIEKHLGIPPLPVAPAADPNAAPVRGPAITPPPNPPRR